MTIIDRIKLFSKRSPVTAILLAIMGVYFVVISLNGGTTNTQALVNFGAFFPPYILQNNEYYRFITSIFIHIGLAHIFFNGYALYIFGTQIERVMGKIKYIMFFLITGIGGNIVTYIVSLTSETSFLTVSAGASGSLFGILGAFLYLIRHHRNMISPEGRKSILTMLAINLGLTLLVPNISTTAHFGGLAIGYLASYIFIK